MSGGGNGGTAPPAMYLSPDGGRTWTAVGSLGGSGGNGSAAGVQAMNHGEPTLTLDPLLVATVGALVDLFDGNAEVAKTVQYDTGLPAERCAEIAEIVEACRRWRNGGGA